MIVNVSGAVSVKVWKQDRLVAHLANMTDDVKLWTTLHGSAASPIAVYTPDTNKDVYIDLTDYVRTYPTVTGINFSFGAGSNWPMSVTVVGLINPASVIVPKHDIGDCTIAPPSKMIVSEDMAIGTIFEFRDPTVNGTNWDMDEYEEDGSLASSDPPTQPSTSISDSNIYKFTLYNSDEDNKTHTFRLVPTSCDKKYAMVEWVSFTGATRRHMFELVKYKTDNANNYSLLDIDNQYKEVKGRVDSFTIRLDGLNNYDLWYYADVCNSSKVKVCVDGTNWHQVQVTTKSFTLPDGGASDGKLEITLNWKRYDAVAM